MSAHPARVTVPRGAGKAMVTVATGLKNETMVEIRSGLKEGDRVLPSPYRGVARKRINFKMGADGN
jgi:hypothetical protein